MTQLKINGETRTINPDLTIGQWQKIKSNEEFYKNRVNLLALYLNMEVNEIKKLPKKNVDFIEAIIRQDLLNHEDKVTEYFTFEFNGVEYGLENDWSKLAWGAWSDIEILSSENIDSNIHHIMSVLYRPIKGSVVKKTTTENTRKIKYKIEPYEPEDVLERAELFKELPIKYWWSVSSFFLRAAKLYTTNLNDSLMLKTKQQMKIKKAWKWMPRWLRRRLPQDFTFS
jgi:hypothetical protein